MPSTPPDADAASPPVAHPLLIVQVGEAIEDVRRRRGDFPRWIRERMAWPAAHMHTIDPRAGAPLPSPESLAGVVVTGSSAMVTARPAWSVRTASWLAEVVAAEVPLLGICYGHQLLADALGGAVGSNPRGREIGTIAVETTPATAADPLWRGLPPAPRFQATHREAVLSLPPGARLLAGNAADRHQAFAVGAAAWGVQFHPEFDADVIRGYIAARAAALIDEGLDPDALAAAATDTQHGTALLRRFGAIMAERLAGPDAGL